MESVASFLFFVCRTEGDATQFNGNHRYLQKHTLEYRQIKQNDLQEAYQCFTSHVAFNHIMITSSGRQWGSTRLVCNGGAWRRRERGGVLFSLSNFERKYLVDVAILFCLTCRPNPEFQFLTTFQNTDLCTGVITIHIFQNVDLSIDHAVHILWNLLST